MENANNRVFTKFQRHVNNAGEAVDANHLNTIQTAVSQAESGLSALQDSDFLKRAVDTLDNSYFTNSLFANEIKDQKYIDQSLSRQVVYTPADGSIRLAPGFSNGDMMTTLVHSSLGDNVRLQDFFLLTDHHIPAGASIRYFLVDGQGGKYPIPANETKLPLHVYADITGFRIQAQLQANAMGESPQLFALAVLFFDEGVEGEYGLTNPDLKRFYQFGIGLTVLVRDRAQEDRLVRIEEQGRTTQLEYSPEGLLQQVVTTFDDDDVVMTDALNYGGYLNSQNVTEQVLLSIASRANTGDGSEVDGSYEFKFLE